MKKRENIVSEFKFTGRNVPINEIAKAMNKSLEFIRVGLQQGYLTFGVAFIMPGNSSYSYYCSDKRVWEEIGYYNPEKYK